MRRVRAWSWKYATAVLAAGFTIAACSETPPAPTAAIAPADRIQASRSEGAGEIWVTAQDLSQLKIVHGIGSIETVQLPAGSGPHEVKFSPSGNYAYVANVSSGAFLVLRASDRQIIETFDFKGEGAGDTGTHEGTTSPDGSVVLVAQIPKRMLYKILANEATESWELVDSLELAESPICTAFRADGQRAYVSVGAVGLAVIDVPSLSLVTSVGNNGILETSGSVQCGLENSKDGRTIYVDSWGEGQAVGHFYLLDTTTDDLRLFTSFAAGDLHGFGVSPNEKWAFVAARGDDELRKVDLTAPGSIAASIPLDPRPGIADRPDKVAVKGNNVYVTMRTAGKLAVIKGNQERVHYIDLAPPSANALHGVAVRP